jgi:metal-sulfur cluster biosynthetic enzyme
MTPLEDTVRRLLDTVHDPCSVRMGQPLGLVGMGLIESVAIDDDAIRIRMVLTGPGCFFYFQFADQIASALVSVADGRDIDVVIDDTILWTRERMNAIPIRRRSLEAEAS